MIIFSDSRDPIFNSRDRIESLKRLKKTLKSVKDSMKLEVTNRRRILKSLRMICNVIFQHQGLLHTTAFKVFICIMDCAFTKRSTVRPRFLPYDA